MRRLFFQIDYFRSPMVPVARRVVCRPEWAGRRAPSNKIRVGLDVNVVAGGPRGYRAPSLIETSVELRLLAGNCRSAPTPAAGGLFRLIGISVFEEPTHKLGSDVQNSKFAAKCIARTE